MATILVEILGNATQLKAELDSAVASTAKANSGFSKMGKAAGVAGLAIAGGLAYGIGKSIGAAADFQQSLNVMQATTNATAGEMAKASKVAIQLGNDVRLPAVSAKDAADAMLELGRDGFTAMQSMKAARGTLLLVTAAQTDTATAAKTVTQNIHAFGLQAKNTNTIVDQMAGFMNATGTSFDGFTDSLSYVAAPAHTVGQTFKETATQLAILSQKGIEGSMAGTGLRQVLVRLGSANSAAGKLFKSMGVDVIDANGKFIGIRETIEKLAPALAAMTSSQRLAFFKQAFGQTAMNQANILFTTTLANYDKTTAAIGRKGQADELAAARMKGFNGAMAQLSSAFETLQIQIGTAFLPVMTSLITEFSTLAGVFVQHQGLTEALIGTIGALAAVLLTVSIATKVVAAYQAIASAATAAWTAAQWLLNAALSANPIGLVIIAVAALTAAVILAYQHSATFRAIVTGAFDAVKTAADAVLSFFRSNWPIIATLISGPFAPLVLLSTNAFGVRSAIENALTATKDFVSDHWPEIATLISGPFAPLVALATNAFGVRSALTGAIGDVKSAVSKGIDDVVGFFKALPGRIVAALGDVSSLLYGAGASIIQGLINGLESKLGEVNNLVSGIAGKIASLKGPIEADRVLLVPHGQAIIEGLKSGLESGLGDLNRMTAGIAPSISGTVGASTPTSTGGGGGSRGGVTVIVNGWVGNDQDIAEKLRDYLIRTGRTTTGGALGGFA